MILGRALRNFSLMEKPRFCRVDRSTIPAQARILLNTKDNHQDSIPKASFPRGYQPLYPARNEIRPGPGLASPPRWSKRGPSETCAASGLSARTFRNCVRRRRSQAAVPEFATISAIDFTTTFGADNSFSQVITFTSTGSAIFVTTAVSTNSADSWLTIAPRYYGSGLGAPLQHHGDRQPDRYTRQRPIFGH